MTVLHFIVLFAEWLWALSLTNECEIKTNLGPLSWARKKPGVISGICNITLKAARFIHACYE